MLAEFAAARATAIDTPRMAFAPRFDLFGVPSRSFNVLSTLRWALTSMPKTSSAITVLTLLTARNTVFPPEIRFVVSKFKCFVRSSGRAGRYDRPAKAAVCGKLLPPLWDFRVNQGLVSLKTPSISNMIPVCFMLHNLNLIANGRLFILRQFSNLKS